MISKLSPSATVYIFLSYIYLYMATSARPTERAPSSPKLACTAHRRWISRNGHGVTLVAVMRIWLQAKLTFPGSGRISFPIRISAIGRREGTCSDGLAMMHVGSNLQWNVTTRDGVPIVDMCARKFYGSNFHGGAGAACNFKGGLPV